MNHVDATLVKGLIKGSVIKINVCVRILSVKYLSQFAKNDEFKILNDVTNVKEKLNTIGH